MPWEIDNRKCVSCTGCVGVCPFAALDWSERNGVRNDRNKCVLCGVCEKFCPSGAIKVRKDAEGQV